ncbi:XRE family transcriptional regulator [Eubacteriales bacterium OttesenSCG-928-N13]|nr:XRE family transcriptional regulator [Eubacteriales bacterium OttesenSCG-928-N13]
MEIGARIKQLRLQRGLTQEELADRCELSKGFISLMERDLTSPSIATLVDVLESLGSDLPQFFRKQKDSKLVFGVDDTAVKLDDALNGSIRWLVPSAQKNSMEPILVELGPGGETQLDDPHEGEEFGYVLSGAVTILIGDRKVKARKDESFYYQPTAQHKLMNTGKVTARVLWVSTPPTF